MEIIELHDKFYELLDKGDNKGAMDVLVKIKMINPKMYNTLLGAFAEDESEIDKEKSDLNKDGKISEYEQARGKAIADAMEKLVASRLKKKEEDAEIDTKKADLNKDGKISEYEKARGQAIADAMEKDEKKEEESDCDEESGLIPTTELVDAFHQLLDSGNQNAAREVMFKVRQYNPEIYKNLEKMYINKFIDKKEEDAERCPVTGKLRKKSDEESCDEEDEQEVALSPQAINQMMIDRGRHEMQRHHQIERMFRHGY